MGEPATRKCGGLLFYMRLEFCGLHNSIFPLGQDDHLELVMINPFKVRIRDFRFTKIAKVHVFSDHNAKKGDMHSFQKFLELFTFISYINLWQYRKIHKDIQLRIPMTSGDEDIELAYLFECVTKKIKKTDRRIL